MTPEDFLSESAALRESGLDFVRVALGYAGIEVTTLSAGSDPTRACLVYGIGDGTGFVVKGNGRNDYSVGRYYVDAPDGDDPTHFEDHLNLAGVLRVLTFERPLDLYIDFDSLPIVQASEYEPKLRRGSILRRMLGR